MPEKSFTLKETLFTRQMVIELARAIQYVDPSFPVDTFLARVIDASWPNRELKDRMRHITIVLHSFLPADFRAALDILLRANAAHSFGGFVGLVPSDYVAVYGLEDYEAAIPALEVFTQSMSAEFAVRPFIIRYPDRLMAQMLLWADHPHEGVRRLATEGCRPRLPWGMALLQLKKDPSPILPILEKLKDDPSETVRRSVANNLNDISKDNPQVVIDVLRRWTLEDMSVQVQSIVKQALRTLIKAGNPDALALLGVEAAPQIEVRNVRVEPAAIQMGEAVILSFEIESCSDEPQDLVIDYVLHLVRAGGKSSEKVFKLAKRTLQPGEIIRIKRRHSFREITTRRYYPGLHALQPKINGQTFDRSEFMLEA